MFWIEGISIYRIGTRVSLVKSNSHLLEISANSMEDGIDEVVRWKIVMEESQK